MLDETDQKSDAIDDDKKKPTSGTEAFFEASNENSVS